MKTCANCDDAIKCTEMCPEMKKYLDDSDIQRPSWLVYVGDLAKLDYFANSAPFTLDDPPILDISEYDIELASLTYQQRRCMKMYYISGLTQEEIAKNLDIDQKTVSQHLIEGCKKVDSYHMLLGEEEWEVVERCNLSKRQKQCFYLQKFVGLSQREIASKLGISRATVRTQLKRAENKLLNHLKPT